MFLKPPAPEGQNRAAEGRADPEDGLPEPAILRQSLTLTAGQQHAISTVAPPCFRAESVLSPCPARSQRPRAMFSIHGHPAPDADKARSSSGSAVHRSRRKHGAARTHALRTHDLLTARTERARSARPATDIRSNVQRATRQRPTYTFI